MPTDPKLVRDCFLAAAELPLAERSAYLAAHCGGDAELRAAVERLLAAHERPAEILNRPSPREMDDTLALLPSEQPGAVIAGRYKLLEVIGEGGMGTVFLAEQSKPVQRKVALKIIKPGMDSRQVLARFEAERQALAIMDHFNIAHVLDAGTTDHGRPYFVMELIHGVPITKYCDDNRLTPRQRLELFLPLCQAIQHAHQKGIIHRDIKPSNVLVTLYDGKPAPKVIDFGVAKAIERKLTEQTLFTNYGTMVGTLEYMSPEQAEMSALGVDTRSDVYSLGVLLYELLTGNTPLNRKQLREAAYEEILRLIKEVDPPKPSTRLSDSGALLESISAKRHMDPAKLSSFVRGELDWIVMKALEKDRMRRYESASALAADVRNFLNDDPVLACPPSASYRLRKFARRHRSLVLSSLLLVASLLLGLVATSWQMWRARQSEQAATKSFRAEKAARKDAEASRKQTSRSLASEAMQRQRAESNLYRSLVRETQALRAARVQGYRSQAWALLEQANDMKVTERDPALLRQEAVNCMGDFLGQEAIDVSDLGVTRGLMALHPNDRYVAVAMEDKSVLLWDLATKSAAARLVSHESALTAIAFKPQTNDLVSADVQGNAIVWQESSPGSWAKKKSWRLPFESYGFPEVKNGLATSANCPECVFVSFGHVSLWDTAAEEPRLTIQPQQHPLIAAIALSPDGNLVAIVPDGVHASRKVWLCDRESLSLVRTIVPPIGPINCLEFSPDGRFLALGADLGLVTYTVEDGRQWSIARSDAIEDMCFSADSQYLAFATMSKVVHLWSHATQNSVAVFHHPDRRLSGSLRFTHDDKRLLSIGATSLRIWSINENPEKVVFPSRPEGVPGVAFSPDGRWLASASKDSTVALWDLKARSLEPRKLTFEGKPQTVAFSPDGRWLACGGQGVGLWDMKLGKQSMVEKNGAFAGLAFSPDGKQLAASSNGLKVWRMSDDLGAPAFELIAAVDGQDSLSLAWRRDSKQLVWIDGYRYLRRYHTETKADGPIFVSPISVGWHGLAYDDRTQRAVFVSRQGSLEAWNVEREVKDMTLGEPASFASGHVAISSDGRWLAVDATPNRVTIFDLERRAIFVTLPAERAPIWSLAWSTTAEQLAIGLSDGGLVMWNLSAVRRQLADLGLEAVDEGLSSMPSQETVTNERVDVEVAGEIIRYMSGVARNIFLDSGRYLDAERAYRRVLESQERVLGPDSPATLKTRVSIALAQAALARYDEAIALMSAAYEKQVAQAGRDDFDTEYTRYVLASMFAQSGRAATGRKLYYDAYGDAPLTVSNWYWLSMLHLADDDLTGYRALCEKQLRSLASGEVKLTGSECAWCCKLAPDAVGDWTEVVKLAQDFANGNPNVAHFQADLGGVLFRAGKYEAATAAFRKALELSPNRVFWDGLWLSLCLGRQNQMVEAREWLAKASAAADNMVGDNASWKTWNWANAVEWRRLQLEAIAIVGTPEDSPKTDGD